MIGVPLWWTATVIGAHYGLRDWLAQRVTAVVMLLYTLFFLAVLVACRARLRRTGARCGAADHALRNDVFVLVSRSFTRGLACATSSWITSRTRRSFDTLCRDRWLLISTPAGRCRSCGT